jgi:hypothetical protein
VVSNILWASGGGTVFAAKPASCFCGCHLETGYRLLWQTTDDLAGFAKGFLSGQFIDDDNDPPLC